MSDTNILEMPQIHAHICKRCLSEGIETVWVHQDIKRGDVQAHKCPKCGTVEWQKFMVPVGQLPPQHRNVNAPVNVIPIEAVMQILSITFLMIGIFVAFYIISLRFKATK